MTTTNTTIQGYFKGINDYSQILMTLDETNAKIITDKTKGYDGNSPLSAPWTGRDEQSRYSLKVALEPKDKNVSKRFAAIANLAGKNIKLMLKLAKYDFEKDGEHIQGWRAVLVDIKIVKDVVVSPAAVITVRKGPTLNSTVQERVLLDLC